MKHLVYRHIHTKMGANIFLGSVIVGVCFLLLKLFDNKVGDIAPNYTVFDSDGNHLFDIFKEK